MTSCKLFFIITIVVILIATAYIVHSQYRMFLRRPTNEANNFTSEIDRILDETLAGDNIPEWVKITINRRSNNSSAHEIILNELNKNREEINTLPHQKLSSNKIQIKNLVITTNQYQQIIKENFVHTNYVEAVHIICSNGLLITCIIERTETTKSIEETYTHINRAINNQLDTNRGNVILILDGSLNLKRTIGHKFTLHSTGEQQIVEFPCFNQTTVNVKTNYTHTPELLTPVVDTDSDADDTDIHKDNGDDDEDISIIANENLYGFNSRQNNSKFRQTPKDSGHKKYLNHVKNIIFP